MGLTIHYQITIRPANTEHGVVEPLKLVQRARRRAQKFQQQGRVDAVGPILSDSSVWEMAPRFVRRLDPEHGWKHQPMWPEAGWLFWVQLGEGCEPLKLGLCRYPLWTRYVGSSRARQVDAVWRLEGFCKTQYASNRSWEHFRCCHIAAIELLDEWRTFGARVTIMDEGRYWPGGSEAMLQRTLREYNQSIAALGGALKDATPRASKAPTGPIFDHPQFEHLEAEGLAVHGEKLGRAVAAIQRLNA